MIKTLTLLLLVAVTTAGAQTDSLSLFKKYELETIYLSGSGNRYFKNNQSFRLRELSNEFNFTPQGLALYQGYRSDRRKFIATYTIGLGLLLGGLAVSHHHGPTAAVMGVTSFIPIAFSFHFLIRSQNRLSKAIWIRNRDTLLRK